MTEEELREFEEQNWARVPEADRQRCIEHLRKKLPPGEETRIKWLQWIDEPAFHMMTGMVVRNSLRDVLPDDKLPDVDYPGGRSYRNWDDFYMAALREALA